jgi:TolA-binding protein
MIERRVLKYTVAVVALALAVTAPPAFAVNKDMVQLQTQVQQLQDAVARLQQSNDERMGVLKDLVQQSADSVNKMSLAVDALQQQMHNQQDATAGKLDQVSGQVQSLNDSLDEVKARLNNLEKALQSVENQQQSINAAMQNMSPSNPAGTTQGSAGSSGADQSGVVPGTPTPQQLPLTAEAGGKPSADVPFATTQGRPIPGPSAAAPPATDLYKTALSDYMAAKYPLATSEFSSVTRVYPDNPLAGNAFYYLGEIDYRQGRFAAAVKDYDHVLEQFPDSSKTAVSHLHKGQALLSLKQTDAGIEEMRALIARFPNSPEAVQARSRLNGMGVSAAPKRP